MGEGPAPGKKMGEGPAPGLWPAPAYLLNTSAYGLDLFFFVSHELGNGTVTWGHWSKGPWLTLLSVAEVGAVS